jgi:spore maturation protein CgeB
VLHVAADTSVFGPLQVPRSIDVVFVGNYGDGDRSDELEDYLFGPRADLPDLRYAVYGVRYPEHVVARMSDGLDVSYRGWLPNVDVPSVYSAARTVLHVPRRQYLELLPGTPTIRVFEALACRACLISLPWEDTDQLFCAGDDFAVASSPREMRELIDWLCHDDAARERIAAQGYARVLARHTCAHRADELLALLADTRSPA